MMHKPPIPAVLTKRCQNSIPHFIIIQLGYYFTFCFKKIPKNFPKKCQRNAADMKEEMKAITIMITELYNIYYFCNILCIFSFLYFCFEYII